MANQPLISVIVPVYKVEDYLNRCVNSVVNQTYQNLEIILVDDGSPDNCPKICDDWIERDNRIKVIHKENGGLSDARNAGLTIANGEYISYIDSDDFITEEFIATMLSTMQQQNSDVVECNITKVYEDGGFEPYIDDLSIADYSTANGLSALIDEQPFHQYVWNKLYKAKIVKDIPFAVGKLNEDEFWTYQVFGRARKLTKLNKTMYYYFQRSSSIMGQYYNIQRLDALEGKANRQKYIDEYYPELSSQAKIDLYGSCIYAYQNVIKYLHGEDRKKGKRIIYNYKNRYQLTIREIKTADPNIQKYLYFSKASFYLCCKFRSVLGIGF